MLRTGDHVILLAPDVYAGTHGIVCGFQPGVDFPDRIPRYEVYVYEYNRTRLLPRQQLHIIQLEIPAIYKQQMLRDPRFKFSWAKLRERFDMKSQLRSA